MFLFCLTMEPVYARFRAVMGEEGALYAYCDESYLIAKPGKMTEVMARAPRIYGKAGLKIGYGPGNHSWSSRGVTRGNTFLPPLTTME
jgi:hypothetical protein